MNREQRRNLGISPLTMRYGHDEAGHVVMIFSKMTEMVRLTDQQVTDMIKALKDAQAKAAHQRAEHKELAYDRQ